LYVTISVQTVVSDRSMAIGKVAQTLLLLSVTVAGKIALASSVDVVYALLLKYSELKLS